VSGPREEVATTARPVWVVGGSPEREWIASALRRRGYVNCTALRGSEASLIPLEAGGMVFWYSVGGVSSMPPEITDGWLNPGRTALPAGANDDGFTVLPLPHDTTAVVMRMSAADRFAGTLERLPLRFEPAAAR
jgi:hypothetical protein